MVSKLPEKRRRCVALPRARRKVRVPGVSGVLEFTAARRGLAPRVWLLGSPARGPERARPVPLTFVCFCFCGWKTEMLFS